MIAPRSSTCVHHRDGGARDTRQLEWADGDDDPDTGQLRTSVGRQAGFTAEGDRPLADARRIVAVHDDALARLGDARHRHPMVIGSTGTAVEQARPQPTALRAVRPERPVRFQLGGPPG